MIYEGVKMKIFTTDEIVEQYINGNLTLVKKGLRDNTRWAFEIRDRIEELYGGDEANRFSQLMQS